MPGTPTFLSERQRHGAFESRLLDFTVTCQVNLAKLRISRHCFCQVTVTWQFTLRWTKSPPETQGKALKMRILIFLLHRFQHQKPERRSISHLGEVGLLRSAFSREGNTSAVGDSELAAQSTRYARSHMWVLRSRGRRRHQCCASVHAHSRRSQSDASSCDAHLPPAMRGPLPLRKKELPREGSSQKRVLSAYSAR